MCTSHPLERHWSVSDRNAWIDPLRTTSFEVLHSLVLCTKLFTANPLTPSKEKRCDLLALHDSDMATLYYLSCAPQRHAIPKSQQTWPTTRTPPNIYGVCDRIALKTKRTLTQPEHDGAMRTWSATELLITYVGARMRTVL